MMQCLTYLHRSIAVLLADSRGDGGGGDDGDVDATLGSVVQPKITRSAVSVVSALISILTRIADIYPLEGCVCVYIYV